MFLNKVETAWSEGEPVFFSIFKCQNRIIAVVFHVEICQADIFILGFLKLLFPICFLCMLRQQNCVSVTYKELTGFQEYLSPQKCV